MKHIAKHQTVSHIALDPAELDNVKGNIKKKLIQTIGKCDQHGYIIDIHDIDYASMKNIISRNSGHCIYTIAYVKDVFIPRVDDVYSTTIIHVFKDGIFCKYFDMKILIPCQMIPWLTFEYQYFIDKKTNTTYSVGTNVSVRIVMVRYDHNTFQCIGVIDEKTEFA